MTEGALVDEAIAKAVREAVRRHVQAGNPIATMQRGKVKLLGPSQVQDLLIRSNKWTP